MASDLLANLLLGGLQEGQRRRQSREEEEQTLRKSLIEALIKQRFQTPLEAAHTRAFGAQADILSRLSGLQQDVLSAREKERGATQTLQEVSAPSAPPGFALPDVQERLEEARPRAVNIAQEQALQTRAGSQMARNRLEDIGSLSGTTRGLGGILGGLSRTATAGEFSDEFEQDFTRMHEQVRQGGDAYEAFIRLARVYRKPHELDLLKRAFLSKSASSSAEDILFGQQTDATPRQ